MSEPESLVFMGGLCPWGRSLQPSRCVTGELVDLIFSHSPVLVHQDQLEKVAIQYVGRTEDLLYILRSPHNVRGPQADVESDNITLCGI
jgi:hypothetical protein